MTTAPHVCFSGSGENRERKEEERRERGRLKLREEHAAAGIIATLPHPPQHPPL